MRPIRLLLVPLMMLFVLACGLSNGIQQIQQAATQLPDILTSAPTALGVVETMVASAVPPSNCPATPTAGGLGIASDRAKTVLQATQQFTFTDGTVDGQPASTATLASAGASAFSAISNGFSVQFIGDPCNLSRILITAPYTDQQATVEQGLAASTILFSSLMPLDVQLPLLAWLSQNYSNLPVAGQQQTTIKNMQFTMSRTQTEMSLEIIPAN
jgi:hypothetical protein